MSLTKKYLKTRPVCKVTFKLSRQEANAAQQVSLMGDFNQWNSESNPMKRLKDGSFSLTVDLPTDNSYHFRYLMDGQHWENDPAADALEPSPLGHAENSVIRL